MSAPLFADTTHDVEAATQQWVAAFNRKSPVDIVALYAKDAVFFGTSSPFTFVYQLRQGKWMLVEHHSSAVP